MEVLGTVPVRERIRLVVWMWVLFPLGGLLSTLYWVLLNPTPIERANLILNVVWCVVSWLGACGLARRKEWARIFVFVLVCLCSINALVLLVVDEWVQATFNVALAATGVVLTDRALDAEF